VFFVSSKMNVLLNFQPCFARSILVRKSSRSRCIFRCFLVVDAESLQCQVSRQRGCSKHVKKSHLLSKRAFFPLPRCYRYSTCCIAERSSHSSPSLPRCPLYPPGATQVGCAQLCVLAKQERQVLSLSEVRVGCEQVALASATTGDDTAAQAHSERLLPTGSRRILSDETACPTWDDPKFSTCALDATWEELKDRLDSGGLVFKTGGLGECTQGSRFEVGPCEPLILTKQGRVGTGKRPSQPTSLYTPLSGPVNSCKTLLTSLIWRARAPFRSKVD